MSFFIKSDLKGFDKFAKLAKSAAIGVIKRSIRMTVNDQAWSTQKQAKFREIPKSMTTRGNFNQRTVRVTTARGRSLVSEVGNIKFKGYKGLSNLEKGKSEKNPAIPHEIEVRSGNRRKRVSKTKRLGNIGTFKNVTGGAFLSTLSRTGYTGYFRVSRNSSTKLSPGIYKFKGKGRRDKTTGFLNREILMVRDTQHPRTKPKRNQWLLRSSKRGASQSLTSRFWQRNQDKTLKKALDKTLK